MSMARQDRRDIFDPKKHTYKVLLPLQVTLHSFRVFSVFQGRSMSHFVLLPLEYIGILQLVPCTGIVTLMVQSRQHHGEVST
jgi:hypothetical protein